MPFNSEQITDLVGPVVRELGYDLEEVSVTNAGARSAVTVVVDRDGGSTLDELSDLTREVSQLLDADDRLPATAYTLEITSRGMDRPLTEPRHWRRAQGRKVSVEMTTEEGASTIDGRVGELSGDIVTVLTNNKGRLGSTDVDINSVTKAVVQPDFSRPSVAELERCGLDDSEIMRRRGSDVG